MLTYLAVFVGGGFGSCLRLAVSHIAARHAGSDFPWGTLSVNLLGAFLIGLIVELLALKLDAPASLRYLLVTGFLGGFTTFSAFSLESAAMLERGDHLLLVAYVAASVIGTIALVFAGMFLVRQLLMTWL